MAQPVGHGNEDDSANRQSTKVLILHQSHASRSSLYEALLLTSRSDISRIVVSAPFSQKEGRGPATDRDFDTHLHRCQQSATGCPMRNAQDCVLYSLT